MATHIHPPRDMRYRWEGHGSEISLRSEPPASDERTRCCLLLLKMKHRPCKITHRSYMPLFSCTDLQKASPRKPSEMASVKFLDRFSPRNRPRMTFAGRTAMPLS